MEKLLTNKYFCIAILIALVVMIYLYSQSDYCSMEPMQNVDLTPLAQEFSETPWTNGADGSKFSAVDTTFDTHTDAFTKNKLKKNGYNVANFLPRTDVAYMNYINSDSNSSELSPTTASTPIKKKSTKKKSKSKSTSKSKSRAKSHPHFHLPQPLDDRPDLSQCQPCAPCGIVSGVSGSMRH